MVSWATAMRKAIQELRMAAQFYQGEGLTLRASMAEETANDLADVYHQWGGSLLEEGEL